MILSKNIFYSLKPTINGIYKSKNKKAALMLCLGETHILIIRLEIEPGALM